MRRALLIVAPIALFAAPAFAQVTGTVTVDGSVADRCLFTTNSATISVGELALQGSGSTAGRLDTSKLNGQTRTLIGWCNGTAATMTVEALPLFNTDVLTAPTGFDRRVNYTATALANSRSTNDSSTTDGPGSPPANVGLFTGSVDVTLSASSSPTNGLLVAGGYSGSVIVTLTPSIALPR